MPSGVSAAQAELDDLQATVDEAIEILEAVNTVTATRTELAQAVVDALESLSLEDEDEEAAEDSDED